MITSTDPLSNHVNRKQYLKLSSNVKEAVLKHRQAYEQRLQEDFKQVGKICTSKKLREIVICVSMLLFHLNSSS